MHDTQYTTMTVDAPQRFDYWKEVVCRHCIPADSKPLGPESFDARLEVRELGIMDICNLSAPLHYWERTARHLRSGPDEDLWLGFTRRGFGELEQGGRKTKLAADNLFLYDASQTFRFSLGGTENHLLRIPRHLLTTRLPGIENFTASVLDNRRPGVIPLRELLREAAVMPEVQQDAGLATRLSQTVLELLLISLELQDIKQEKVELDLYGRVMNYIHRHLTETDLCVERIAQAHHVSTRTITRAFARHQKTPASVIWQERLKASREAIERGHVRSVSQAALDFGFSDFSHYSHAFRNAYGVTPQKLLRREKSICISLPIP